jgi:hypothetical protein
MKNKFCLVLGLINYIYRSNYHHFCNVPQQSTQPKMTKTPLSLSLSSKDIFIILDCGKVTLIATSIID